MLTQEMYHSMPFRVEFRWRVDVRVQRACHRPANAACMGPFLWHHRVCLALVGVLRLRRRYAATRTPARSGDSLACEVYYCVRIGHFFYTLRDATTTLRLASFLCGCASRGLAVPMRHGHAPCDCENTVNCRRWEPRSWHLLTLAVPRTQCTFTLLRPAHLGQPNSHRRNCAEPWAANVV